MPLIDPETFFSELEESGETQIRNRLATDRIYGGDKRPLVVEWLRRKDESRLDGRESRQKTRETTAAIAAITAAVAATIGAIASIIILFSK
jgi:hypothetical protein